MAEIGEGPQTLQKGFWRSVVAGTGTVNLTFFSRRRTGSGGQGRETETRQGHPQGEETAGVIREAEMTGFRLSTDTESDLSSI